MSTRSNPLVPQSPVVVNGWNDRHFANVRRNKSGGGSPYTNVSPENFNIMPRELCFTLTSDWDKHLSRPDSSRGSDYGPRVFTSANGFPVDIQRLRNAARAGQQELRIALRAEVAFVGVPLTAIDAANANQKDGVSICVAGATSIINTGPKRIATGDLVMWDFPPPDRSYVQARTKRGTGRGGEGLLLSLGGLRPP